jgi:hypothetical protein
MVKLKTVRFSKLPNAAHYQFCTFFRDAVNAAPENIRNALAALMVGFSGWIVKFAAILEWTRKSDLTKLIAAADRRMESDLVGLNATVTAALHSKCPDTQAAAARIFNMLKQYGYVSKKPYESQLGDVQIILENLNGTYAADVAVINAGSWTDSLEASYAGFVDLCAQRNAWKAQKPADTTKNARVQLETNYRAMAGLINAKAITSADSYAAFITSVNPEIERINAEYYHARKDIAACQPAPIAAQQYTGRPVTPTPDVLYVTTHEGTVTLELGRDYNLAFKDNVNVGNAQCIIRGKGKYRGSKTVTFIIARL